MALTRQVAQRTFSRLLRLGHFHCVELCEKSVLSHYLMQISRCQMGISLGHLDARVTKWFAHLI
jgi:hypothetical protein